MIFNRFSRQKPSLRSQPFTLLTCCLSATAANTTNNSSKLYDHYSFKPPPSLSPKPENPNPTLNPNKNFKKKSKPQYRPPSSLDAPKKKYTDLPFDFRYSYTETNQNVRPIGLREPKYSPFGPGRLEREWTGVCAPAADPKVKSAEEGAEDPNLEEKRILVRERIQGEPLTNAERKALVEKGRNYNPKKRPVIPLMLWRPHEPVYPKLIKTTIEGLSIEETKEMRKRRLAVPVLTKLAKNGYYGSLVPMVRDAFLVSELVRIDCQGLERSDYKKIGCKLRDLVPCILVTFEKEQIVVWRGKDYKHPGDDGQFFTHRELFDDPENDSACGVEEEVMGDSSSQQDFCSGDDE
ncbi:CRS2-associated factor 1 [Citrus sinensis]|nr:CRS2-associated factor 1 [Citrus sinensis]